MAARTGALSITTYAIGVFGDMDRAEGEPALNSWAMAGGSGSPSCSPPATISVRSWSTP